MDCPDERTWEGRRRRIRRYGLSPIHLAHRLGSTLPRTGGTTEAPNPQGRKGNPRNGGKRTRAVQAEYSLATLQAQWQDHEAHRGVGVWIEEEPEETHWDRGTQTEDDVMEQCLLPKKRPIQIEEESP